MKIQFVKPNNIVDLFIRDYDLVPEKFKSYIPHPKKGWVSLRYKKLNVEFIINTYGNYIDDSFKYTVIDRITLDQAKFLESEVEKWNQIAINLIRKRNFELLNYDKRYKKWLMKLKKEETENHKIDIKLELILDNNKNIIRYLTYDDFGLTLRDLI